jgi:hypothetical protein
MCHVVHARITKHPAFHHRRSHQNLLARIRDLSACLLVYQLQGFSAASTPLTPRTAAPTH